MRSARYAIASAILYIGLCAGGAFAQSGESENKSDTPAGGTAAPAAVPPGKATVFFKRESSLLGIANDAKVFIDGNQVCAVASGNDCKVAVEPGKRVVKIDAALSTGEFSRAFEFKPEQTYTFAVSARSGSVLGAFGGLFGMIADNAINQDETGKDNGVFTAKLVADQ
jgi:hypothetical protein